MKSRTNKRTAPVKLRVGGRSITVSHSDKLLFPKSKITKAELIAYYQKIAPVMIPKVKDRPLVMVRYPHGIADEGFFQKNVASYFPDWIETVSVARQSQPRAQMVLCNNAATLVYLANQDCITPHIWLSSVDSLRCPDRMIFDLDPGEHVTFAAIMEAAKLLRALLEKLCLKPFVMTTGSRGLHVVVPLKPELPFAKVRAVARTIAASLVNLYPEHYTIEHRIARRRGKIFIDYLRNAYAQTGVAPYAVRAIEGAPVATPLRWEELTSDLTSQRYTIHNIFTLLRKRKDPWARMKASARSLKRLTARLP